MSDLLGLSDSIYGGATFPRILGNGNARSEWVPNFLGGGAQYPRIFGMGMPSFLGCHISCDISRPR